MKLTAAAALTACSLTMVLAAQDGPTLTISSPTADAIVTGPTRLEAAINPRADVQNVSFFVDGRLVCTADRAPYSCSWDPGTALRGHHVRVVASLAGGRRLVENLRTKDVGYSERVRTNAVLVPVIVTDHGQFVRGLKKADFAVFEDQVAQPIASMVSEDAPLDLVLSIDISGSMEHALPEVKLAVKELLSKLRPGDAATLVGFNDTTFLLAEREKDQKTRERAVDLLTSWGGTALYDATVRSIDLVSREWGRKGVVIFSDGDDRNSLTKRETAMAKVQASDAMLYTIGFGGGADVARLRASLENYSKSTGGRAFFPKRPSELDAVFEQIVAELANQYVLSYSPTNVQQDSKWRNIKVQVRKGNYEVRARRGYRASGPQRAER